MTVVFMLFILPMLLLFVYPFPLFQRILNKVGINSVVLRTFVEVFQGYYKDGTNGTRDYRSFSGLLLFLPFAMMLTFYLIQSSFYFPIASIWLLLYLILHLTFQPFKKSSHNYIMIGMSVAMLGLYWGTVLNADVQAQYYQEAFSGYWLVSIALMASSIPIPFLYLLGLVFFLIKKSHYAEN